MEVNIMINVEKVIRVLGYIVYTIIWSPVIILCLTIMPIVYGANCIKIGEPIKNVVTMYKNALLNGVQHDVNFIQTGKW